MMAGVPRENAAIVKMISSSNKKVFLIQINYGTDNIEFLSPE
jgi:hypothetical protein